MYSVAMWKCYYKLMNNMLPSYFILMKPELPPTVNKYEIRRPNICVPFIKHVFAEHLLKYQMIIKPNELRSIHYSSKVFTHSFLGFKFYFKNNLIDSGHCNITNYRSCYICYIYLCSN